MDENFQFIAGELGDACTRIPFSSSELSYLEKRVPERLFEFMEHSGHACYLDGGVTICPASTFAPILALVFKGDPDLDHRDCTVVSYTAFGNLHVWSKKHGNIVIYLAEGQLTSVALAPTEFAPGIVPQRQDTPDPNIVASGAVVFEPEELDFLDYRGSEMLRPCIAAHGALELGDCFGFFPALGLVGADSPTRRVENIKKVKALEHFAMLAQLQPFYLTKLDRSGIKPVREIGQN